MAILYIVHVISGILGTVTYCGAHSIAVAGNRDLREVTRDVSQDADATMIRISALLDSLDELMAMSPQDIQSMVGDTGTYATDKLKILSELLQETTKTHDDSSQEIVVSMVTHIRDLGYLIAMDMQMDESRRLSYPSVTIYLSKFQSSKFQGVMFSTNTGNDIITIPHSIALPDGATDVTYVIYSVSGVAQSLSGDGNITIASDVIVAFLLDYTGKALPLTYPDEVYVTMKTDELPVGKQPVCNLLRRGVWGTEGCETEYPVQFHVNTVKCRCQHLGVYAVTFTDKPYVARLGVAAMLGSGCTILFCLVTALVFIGYRLMHSVRCYIRFSFLTALAMAEMMYLCIRYTEAAAVCVMAAAGSHFFATASFTWLLSYALFLGNDMLGDDDTSLHVTHFTFLGWAIPLAVVLISYIWRYDQYVHEHYCWISADHGLPYAFVIPISVIIAITVSVLVYDITVYMSIKDPKMALRLQGVKSGLRSCCCLLPVLSAVWLLAHFMVNIGYLWLQVTFSVLNVILGVMVFLIMFWFNEEVMIKRKKKPSRFMELWKRKISFPIKRKLPSSKSTEMTMLWGGIAQKYRPSTSAEGEGSHPYSQTPNLDQESPDMGQSSPGVDQSSPGVDQSSPDVGFSSPEGGRSMDDLDVQESPRYLHTLRDAPIASSEDSLLTRESTDSPAVKRAYSAYPRRDNGATSRGSAATNSHMSLLTEEGDNT